jgi:4-hydroxybenzoate polyprenyltransferase
MILALSARGRPSISALRSTLFGTIAAAALLALYVGAITVAQGSAHAIEQLVLDAPYVLAVTLGLGVQVALFSELRTVNGRHRAGVAATAAGTGASTAAMLACCAHHVADLLPLVGLSAAAVLLGELKTPLLILGLATNAVAIALIARELRRARRACAVAEQAGALA